MRKTSSGIVHAMAGCRVCHNGEAAWYGKTALGLAARHHDATGHETWAEQCIAVKYGGEDESVTRYKKRPASRRASK